MANSPIGGGGGSPSYIDFYDTADTQQIAAASTAMRTDLQMMANNQDIFITQMAGGKPRLYSSNPDNPVLGYQLALQRPANAASTFTQAQLDARYEALLNELPVPMRLALQQNKDLPADQQDPKLTAFADYLTKVSLVSLWFDSYSVEKTQGANPPTVAQVKERMITLGQGAVVALEQVAGNMAAQRDQMPAIDPDRVVLGEYLKMIGKLISTAKQFLQKMEELDAKMAQKDATVQMQQAAAKLKKQLKAFEDQMKAKKKAATMHLVMQIVGPVLAALAVAAAIASGGAGAILVALVLAAMTSADAANGFMTKGMQKLVNEIAEKGHMPKWAAEVIVSVMILVIALLGGAAASADIGGLMEARIAKEVAQNAAMSGEEVAAEAVKQALKEAQRNLGRMMGAQIAATGLSSSGVLNDVAMGLAKKMSKSDSDQQIIAMVLQMLMMLAILAAGGVGGGGGLKSMSAQHIENFSDVIEIGTHAYGAYNEIQRGFIEKEMHELLGEVAQINALISNLKTDQDQNMQQAKNMEQLAGLWSKVFDDIIKGSVQVIQQLTQAS